MPETNRFQPGQTIVVREVRGGKLYGIRPETVVRDTSELLAIYLPPGTIWKWPYTRTGEKLTVRDKANLEWILKDNVWADHRLRLVIPDNCYSVLLFWDLDNWHMQRWYINLEEPFRRNVYGFDYTDQFLDIVIKPDLSSWQWKDEDEFAEAVEIGLISIEKADAIRSEGERVAKWIQSGESPFNGWEKWRPDPSWGVPVLPEGWDKI
jgi:predicted RNA-binding protein associated with RNAse of E/G family